MANNNQAQLQLFPLHIIMKNVFYGSMLSEKCVCIMCNRCLECFQVYLLKEVHPSVHPSVLICC